MLLALAALVWMQICVFTTTQATPFIVQTLSSRYAIVLGGYGPGYEELRDVEIVRHDKICQGAISDVPKDRGRYLGSVSGMAEYVNGTSVLFCRHSSCWLLTIGPNKWRRMGGFTTERVRAASAAVDSTMVVLGGRDPSSGKDLISFERFNLHTNQWENKPEWEMAKARYSFCAVPLNDTALLVVGGYTSSGPTASVELLDTVTGRWEKVQDLPKPRYGHACLLMEWRGRPGVLVSGGALTGTEVVFYDIDQAEWVPFAPLHFHTDGHDMVLVEGIPTVFAWERIEMYDGSEWVTTDLRLGSSRSAFTVTTVPGHLVPRCQ